MGRRYDLDMNQLPTETGLVECSWPCETPHREREVKDSADPHWNQRSSGFWKSNSDLLRVTPFRSNLTPVGVGLGLHQTRVITTPKIVQFASFRLGLHVMKNGQPSIPSPRIEGKNLQTTDIFW